MDGSHFNDPRAADLASRLMGEKDAQGIRGAAFVRSITC